MNYQVFKKEIQVAESQEYARLTTYLLYLTPKFSVQERPLVLVYPGGGYHFTSEREGEIVALQFNAMGYHAAVLNYSCAPAQFPTALLELSKSVAYLRAHAKEWLIDPDRIVVLGFSAGGHLTASLGAIRPNALMLAYPVITSGEYAHRESFDNLLGEARCADEFWLEKMSLEKQDLSDFPPAFIWHTSYDGSVPIENSLFFVTALAGYRKPMEYHVFPGEVHGISLADWRTRSDQRPMDTPAVKWIGLAHTWMENLRGK